MMQPYLPSRWLISTPDLADDPDVFPLLPGQVFVTKKSPTWSTDIKQAVSGRERRRQNWVYPLWNFQVQYEVLRDGPSFLEQQRLIAFFTAHAGQYQQFFYFDPSDNKVVNQPVGTGDGITTDFQLTRTFAAGRVSFTEPVRGLNGNPVVTVNGTATSVTAGAFGQIVFASPPATGAAIAWSGSFLFLCRFTQDNLDVQQMMAGLWSQSGLAFASVKP
jgi:uncharacterized protein (TIGR02217 family)